VIWSEKLGEITVDELGVSLNPASPVPLYHQIADQLRTAIETGRVNRGDYLPSELDLAARWNVSRPTTRRAIQQLVAHGMVVRKRGVGTQVVASHVRRGVLLSSLYDDLARGGRRPTTSVVHLGTVDADDEVARLLEVERHAPVVVIERIRFADGRPLAILHNWLPHDIGEDLTVEALSSAGLYALLRASGVRPMEATQVIEARGATNAEARTLSLDPGAPVLTIQRVMQDEMGRKVELARHAYDARQYSIETTVVAG
jgi:DNA-binding GntR family transcriptional regulator